MSKIRNQSLTIVAIIGAAMTSATNCGLTGDQAATVDYVEKTATETMCTLWRGVNVKNPRKTRGYNPGKVFKANEQKYRKHSEKIMSKIDIIKPVIDKVASDFDLVRLAALCRLMLDDVMRKTKNKRKLFALSVLAEGVEGLHAQLDPKGEQYSALEEAAELMRLIYQKIGFKYQE